MGPSICRCCGSEIWREAEENPNLCSACAEPKEVTSDPLGYESSNEEHVSSLDLPCERRGAPAPSPSPKTSAF
jgi:hypothetical protein